MKISDFKRVSSSLSKTIHSFSLCFETARVSDAGVSYEGGKYHLFFRCYIKGLGVGFISVESKGDDVALMINDFIEKIISNVDEILNDLKKEDNDDEKEWKEWKIYNHEDSCLSKIASIEMLKDILSSFKY